MGNDEAGMKHIGVVAELTGLSLRTLRHYDEVGLVAPSGRTDGGFRLYSDQDVDRLLLIRRMKPLGFSLDEMAQLLTAVDTPAPGEGVDAGTVHKLLQEARTRREQLATKLAMADEFIDLLDHGLRHGPHVRQPGDTDDAGACFA